MVRSHQPACKAPSAAHLLSFDILPHSFSPRAKRRVPHQKSYPLSFHTLLHSFALRKTLSPVFSTNSTLLPQNTPGGVSRPAHQTARLRHRNSNLFLHPLCFHSFAQKFRLPELRGITWAGSLRTPPPLLFWKSLAAKNLGSGVCEISDSKGFAPDRAEQGALQPKLAAGAGHHQSQWVARPATLTSVEASVGVFNRAKFAATSKARP
jgi:hypothetical protein